MSAIDDLATELSKLPGIGRKTALRLTYHLLKQSKEQSRRLAESLLTLSERVKPCERCFNLTEDAICSICRDPRRDQAVLCVVEEPSDIGAIERAGEFRGVYHVLLGHIAPLDGVEPGDLTIDALATRVKSGGIREVVLATNPTLEGEGTALHIKSVLAPHNVQVTRLARGLPTGSQIEYATKAVLQDAIEGRSDF